MQAKNNTLPSLCVIFVDLLLNPFCFIYLFKHNFNQQACMDNEQCLKPGGVFNLNGISDVATFSAPIYTSAIEFVIAS